MTDTFRGHPIYWDANNELFRFVDTDEPTADTWKSRPCGHCGRHNTPEGHDACLGTLPGVMNACCGHGEARMAYVQFPDRSRIGGQEALDVIGALKAKRRPLGIEEQENG